MAQHVFHDGFYRDLERQLRELLGRGLSDVPMPGRLSRNIPGYDAYGVGLNDAMAEPIGVFISHAWRNLMSDLFGIERTPYVFAGVHHHTPGGADGFIHNDFNPVWFPRASGEDELQTPDHQVCSYKTGRGSLAQSQKIQVVRGAVMIFFAANGEWLPGDGGETGLFSNRDARLGEPVLRCPPEDNSLLMFECTPHSYHAYLGRNRRPRTSLIMWVHRPLADAAAVYGEENVERWAL